MIKNGLNKPKPCHRAVLFALDLKLAFDTVSHGTLLHDFNNTDLPNHAKRWLLSYLRDRQTYTEYEGTKSKRRKVKQGVPHGGVVLRFLFNLYMRSLRLPPGEISIVTYVDDVTLLQPKRHREWQNYTRDKISQDPWRQVGQHDDLRSPQQEHQRKTEKRHNVLKQIAGSDWGCTKETLLVRYKAIGRSVLNYAAPIWTPTLIHTNWNILQTKQNAALRTVTGNLKLAPIEHLHRETKMLPVKKRKELLSKQFLLGSYLPSRSDHNIVTELEGKRTACPALNGLFKTSIPYLFDQNTNQGCIQKRAETCTHLK